MTKYFSPWPNSPSSTGEPRGMYGSELNPRPSSKNSQDEEKIESVGDLKFDLQLLKEQLDLLDDEQRDQLFSNYCRKCARAVKPCYCSVEE